MNTHAYARAVSPLVAVALCAAIVGCAASRSAGPYSPQSEGARDTVKAQRLTQEAAGIMDKDPKRAEALLREALTSDLFFGPAHNNLGVLFLGQGKLYEAAGEFSFAQKNMPGHPDPRLNLALTLERAGRTDQALAAYSTALEVYPDHIPSLQGLARLQIRRGKTDHRTRPALEEISLRGESDRWRRWAQAELTKLRDSPSLRPGGS